MQQTFQIGLRFSVLFFQFVNGYKNTPVTFWTPFHKNLLIFIYSRIPLIRITWDCRVAILLDILDYQTVPVMTYILPGNFSLLLLQLGCKTNQRSIPLGKFLQLLVQGHQNPLLCFLVSSQAKKLMEQETTGQEVPQQYRYSWWPL